MPIISSRSPSFRLFDAFLNYSSDTLFELLLCLTPREVLTFGRCMRSLRTLILDERLWIYFCKTRIDGFRDYIQTNEQLNMIRILLRFPTFRHLFQGLQYLKFPLFGWYRLLPQEVSDCHGGLYCLYPVNGRVVCQYVDYFGNGHMDDRSLDVKYDEDSHRIIGHSFTTSKLHDSRFASSIEFFPRSYPTISSTSSSPIIPSSSSASTSSPTSLWGSYSNPYSNRRFVMVPLPPILSTSIATNTKSYENYFSCIGLFTSRYGSHGMEIIHLSLHAAEDETALRFHNFSFHGLQLQAIKITGDPNVPAGKFTFCIDLLTTIDINIPFLQDQRPIIMFPPDRENPVLTNWQQRIPAMQFCARGLGQINRIPGTWQPEWVQCSFVLYKIPIGDQNAMFSIVWDDENDHFRHAMDFRALPEGNMAMIDQALSESRSRELPL